MKLFYYMSEIYIMKATMKTYFIMRYLINHSYLKKYIWSSLDYVKIFEIIENILCGQTKYLSLNQILKFNKISFNKCLIVTT